MTIGAPKLGRERCTCGHQRNLHCGPKWPNADGACVMCEKGCKAFAPADAPDASPDSPASDPPRSR